MVEWEYGGTKKERRASEMSRGKINYFEKIEGEGILRVWHENLANTGKN